MEGGALRRLTNVPLERLGAKARGARPSINRTGKGRRISQPSQLDLGRQSFFSRFARATEKTSWPMMKTARLIIESWQAANFWRVGRYVIMPDHIHLFCAPNTFPPQPLKKWIAHWRNQVTRAWPHRSEIPIWQRDFWDRQLRRSESYADKWQYVVNNPVRHRYVRRAEDWPYQGELNVLEWHDR